MQIAARNARVLAAAALALAFAGAGSAQDIRIDIPHQRFVLKNGLTLIVHEDRKAPIVAVNVWYHVGSKNEKQGKTGFAHLFEHLMFNGSENFDGDYFQVLEKLGATDLNGTTNEDRTNYFQNVPSSAVDTVLWMESDRMGRLLGAITQAKLDEQRGVVQNEKRQGENQPYGMVEETITENTWPAGHPYSWTVIGSMEDLNAASLEDVHEWFRTYYGPSNAVIVIAGDIDAETARQKVEKYFGAIPPGPPIRRVDARIGKMTGVRRATLQDRVPQTRIYRVWNIPPIYHRETDHLDLASDILGQGKTSRLYKRLVYDDQSCTSASAAINTGEIASQFIITANVRPGVDPAAVEKAIDEELERFLKDGPTAEELKRVQTRFIADFLRGVERIGGFGGKSDVLAAGQVYAGSPDAYKKHVANMQAASTADIHGAAKAWLSDGVFVLKVEPFPRYEVISATDVDRSSPPDPGKPPELHLPKLQRATLSNGLRVVLAERRELPVVNMRLMLDAGYAADQFATPGTASMAMAMVDEGTRTRSTLEIADELDLLGMRLGSGSDLDTSVISMSALKANLDKSLELFADVTLNPAFPEDELERQRKQRLAAIQNEKAQPFAMALRVLPKLIYGESHAYASPLTGSGTEAAVSRLTRDDLVKFHQTWFKPNNATIVVVGDTTMAEIKPKLEKAFSGWQKGLVPKKNIQQVPMREGGHVYIIDKPGSLQSVIMGGHVAVAKANPDEVAIQTMNNSLGGQFISRINLNLREDKHWSYGATSLLLDARGQRPFLVIAPVQIDKTKESLAEIVKEFRQILDDKPLTEDEVDMARNSWARSLPGSRETMSELAGGIAEIVNYGLPDDYFETLGDKIWALTPAEVNAAADKVLRPKGLVWVIVGDRAKIEAGIKELNLGPVLRLDADGNPAG
ncbi:MAG: insulinase family protein [Bryobacteraceae bacterium]|nr:insulinase family protein [Bryobacteraceae bacterium]